MFSTAATSFAFVFYAFASYYYWCFNGFSQWCFNGFNRRNGRWCWFHDCIWWFRRFFFFRLFLLSCANHFPAFALSSTMIRQWSKHSNQNSWFKFDCSQFSQPICTLRMESMKIPTKSQWNVQTALYILAFFSVCEYLERYEQIRMNSITTRITLADWKYCNVNSHQTEQ